MSKQQLVLRYTIKCDEFKEVEKEKELPVGVTEFSIGDLEYYECVHLTSITIPEGITRIADDACEDCVNLKSVKIPHSVTEIGRWSFDYCEQLENVIIPKSVKIIGDGAFESCKKLTSVTISKDTLLGRFAFSPDTQINYY